MAGKKPITGILKALDDELGLGLFKQGLHVPPGVTITKRPKYVEPPERITGAAIRQDGEIYTGINHGEAGLNVPGYYKDGSVVEERPDDDYGFVTNTGRYVTRKEALEIIDRNEQVPGGVANRDFGLASEDAGSNWMKKPKELERNINPDFITGTGPIRRLFHGTNEPTYFNELGVFPDSRQGGIHLSTSPDVASAHGLSEKGGRVYPVLADPGRTLDLPGGLPNWYDPDWFKDAAQFHPEAIGRDDILNLSKMINEDTGVQARHLKELGYDSASYGHFNPINLRDPVDHRSFLITDPSRILPEFSQTAQNIGRVRGILAGEPHTKWSEWDPHNDYLWELFGVKKPE